MSRFCSSCGAQMDEGAVTCAACGKSTLQPAGAGTTTATGGLADNVAGMLAYVTIIPAIIFLMLELIIRAVSSASIPSRASFFMLLGSWSAWLSASLHRSQSWDGSAC